MKKLMIVSLFITGSLFAVEGSDTHADATNKTISATSTPATQSQDKNAKLFQYVSACMVNRPLADDVKGLLK